MDVWENLWQKGFSTTFGKHFPDGYTETYVGDWLSDVIRARTEDRLNILEVGCGNASLVPCLLDLNTKGTYTGVDSAKIHLSSVAQKRLNSHLDISLHGETGIETFQSTDQFDIIASVFGLEYTPVDKSLPLLRKLLAPQGELVMIMHHSESSITKHSRNTLKTFYTTDFHSTTELVSDFKSEKVRNRQQVESARDTTQMEVFKTQLTDTGFTNVKCGIIDRNGIPLAWTVSAN